MTIPGGAPALFLTAAAGAAAGYAIDRSLRFNSADSAHLTRTPSSAGNRKTWTWSAWVKRSKLGGYQSLFADQVSGGTDGAAIYFNTGDDTIIFEEYTSGGIQWKLQTTQVFRDCSAWFHLIVVFNSPASTANERMRIYVNGSEVTDFAVRTNPSQNFQGSLNRARITDIASYGAFDTSYFNGYLADIQFLDGIAASPSDLGETDSNGVWQAKEYSGSYGSPNGFHLKFADNSSDAALGTDSSGNSNTWTVNNLQASTGDTTPKENFAAVAYTGNGGTQSISSLSFSPDFVWIKSRSATYDHALFDTVRGPLKRLRANQANAEGTDSTTLTSFNANGFTTGSDEVTNKNNDNYAAWTWSAGANSNKTYTVKVVSDSGNKYRFDDFGTSAVTLELAEGSTYVFDQSDSSNSGHPLRFSTTSNGTHGGGSEYTTGVTTTGTPGSAGAKTTIVVAASAPTLYYYCTQHSGMGGQANTNSTAGASNFDGGIQTVVKANQTKGFSIVSFENGSGTVTVGHGLNAAPKFIITKSRDSSNDWQCYHAGLGNAKKIILNGSGGYIDSSAWGSTDPTTSVFTLNDGTEDSWIAYCWSEIPAFSKLDSYTGSNSANTITTGFKPAFVLIRNTSGSNWYLLDSNRGSSWLEANGSATENGNSNISITYLDNGFTVDGSNVNNNGSNYIYMAFADNLGGEGCDSLVDSPEQRADQTDDGAGGNVVGNYATLNPLAMGSNAVLSNGNLDATASSGTNGIGTTIGMSSGKWYCEVTINNVGSETKIGIGKQDVLTAEAGSQANTWAYINIGDKMNNNSNTSYGNSFTTGDTIGIAFDADGGNLYFYKNGTAQNSGTAAYTGLTDGPYFFHFTARAVGTANDLSANFGARPFHTAAPTGFKALNTANLPTPTIADGSQYFDTKLWTGTGSARSITGYNFSPDWVWIKSRSFSTNHRLLDTVRGATKELYSSTTDAETTQTQSLTAFNSDGFSLGTLSTVNQSNSTFVGWAWDAGSSTATNTDGSITSSIRASQSAGCSIVKWAGTGSVGTVGHGLGATPGWVIVKSLGNAREWVAWHSSFGTANNTDYLYLDTTGAKGGSGPGGYWNQTAPTTTTFSVGDSAAVNGSGSDYIAYCFAPVANYSSMGSFTGNGSADGPFVFTGFRPAWLLVKKTNASESWILHDTARSPINVSSNKLSPNSSNAESSSTFCDILSNGFKLRTSTNGEGNDSGSTYIVVAFAEHPFQTARAR